MEHSCRSNAGKAYQKAAEEEITDARGAAPPNFLLGFTQPKGSGDTPWRNASIAASKPKLLFSRMTLRSVWSAQR
jgi:hypothetical protein